MPFLLPLCHSPFSLSLFSGEGSAFLSFRKGDLIVLENETGEDVMQSGWCYGLCERTGAKGDFPAQCVYSLPTLNKPPPAVLVRSACTELARVTCTVCVSHTWHLRKWISAIGTLSSGKNHTQCPNTTPPSILHK